MKLTLPAQMLPAIAGAMFMAGVVQPVAAETSDAVAIAKNSSSFGAFLAGRHAGANRESRAAARYFEAALTRDPANPLLLSNALTFAIDAGDAERIAPLAERVVEVEPSNRVATLALIVDALRRGEGEVARERLDNAAPGAVNTLLASLLRAWTAAAEGDGEAAYAALERLRARKAFEPFARYHEALIAEFLGEETRATQGYADALAAAGQPSLRLVDAFGRHLERRGQKTEALALYADFLDRAPENPLILAAKARAQAGEAPEPAILSPGQGAAEALYGLGGALARERGLDMARVYLRMALYARPDFALGRNLLADLYELSGDWARAREEHVKASPSSPLYWNSRLQAAIALDRMGETEPALEELRAMVAEAPDRVSGVIALADMLRGDERYAEAAPIYDQAVALTPEPKERDWTLFYSRGVAHERIKQWDKAEADFLRALELRPDQPLVLNYLGYSWIEMGANLERAKKMVEKAVSLRPNDGYIVDSLGWAHYRLGDFEQAVTHLEEAIELKPEDPVINDHLGDAFWRVGRRLEARFQWSHALALEPEEKDEAMIRRKLEIGLDAAEEEREAAAEKPPEDNDG